MVLGHMWQPYLQASCFCLQNSYPGWLGEAAVEQSGLDDDSPVTMTGTNTVVSTDELNMFHSLTPNHGHTALLCWFVFINLTQVKSV